MPAGTSLVKLELMDNPLSPDVAGPLSALIRRQPNLRVLNLSDTGLTDEGVTQLAEALGEGDPSKAGLILAVRRSAHTRL